MITISNWLLNAAFILYVCSSILFVVAVTGKQWSGRDPREHERRFGGLAYILAVIGFLSHAGYIVTRWIASGHSPTSNMFEFMAFLDFCIIFAYLILYRIYRLTVLGAFVIPLGILMLGYAYVFPKEATPLIPALQSYWLQIHVTTAALGEGILSVGFAAGLMYLVRTVPQQGKSRANLWLEIVLSVVLMLVGFIVLDSTFSRLDQNTVFQLPTQQMTNTGQVVNQQVTYTLPAIVAPAGATIVKQGPMNPLMEAPTWMEGKDAARKLNTMIWSILSGLVLYGGLRLLVRKRLGAALQRTVEGIEPELLDEISYRAIAIGYPVFTLGALIFAMIWAEEAWGRFWGWDPKETWAFIVWLFYSAYLHLRLSRGWVGEKSAWMSVIGFVIILITLVVVNLVIAGLHSYAGV
ncbi:c-type cytochrome biogenesis protein CcsB [Brevibacillus sp. SYP-B805]|uniref:c-type cytochrome biogenesis protein CcsB n=1 Tax=Brevibacillus sp. SYP-B805 TaxID=1578199 RepID=UPI0013EC7DA9|nr:c-type cytochrome biogenesis protein CcsB [Brevibacillus sp. SYP-B805]NGQ94625.1 c-type cytochrome biogenesis protein CcsB [Brevibacillus sp. SYP-B805]